MLRFDIMYRYPDMATGYTWSQMQALVPYHGCLKITLSILSRN
jgi:hypothetical protein